MNPLKWQEINLENIVCHKIKNMGNKKVVLIRYNDNNNLVKFVFQTPRLKTILSNGGLNIELSLTTNNEFQDFVNNIEINIKELAQKNALTQKWFNLYDNNSYINFKKIIRDNDIMKLKILNDNDFKTEIILEDKGINLENNNDLTSKIILELYGIWINNKNDFGIILRSVLVSFKEIKNKKYNYVFINDSDSDDDINTPDTELSNNNDIFLQITNKTETEKIQLDDLDETTTTTNLDDILEQ